MDKTVRISDRKANKSVATTIKVTTIYKLP